MKKAYEREKNNKKKQLQNMIFTSIGKLSNQNRIDIYTYRGAYPKWSSEPCLSRMEQMKRKKNEKNERILFPTLVYLCMADCVCVTHSIDSNFENLSGHLIYIHTLAYLLLCLFHTRHYGRSSFERYLNFHLTRVISFPYFMRCRFRAHIHSQLNR